MTEKKDTVLLKVGLLVAVPVEGKLFMQNPESLAANLKMLLSGSAQELYKLMAKSNYGIESLEASSISRTDAGVAISKAYAYLNAASGYPEDEEDEDGD